MAESKIKNTDISYTIDATNLHANIGNRLFNVRRTGNIIIISGFIVLDNDIPFGETLFSLTTPLIRTYSVITRYADGTSLAVYTAPDGTLRTNGLLPAGTYYMNIVLPAE